MKRTLCLSRMLLGHNTVRRCVMNKYMTRRSWLGAAAMFAVSGVAAGQEAEYA